MIINRLWFFLFFGRHRTWSSFWKSLSRLNISSEKLLPEFHFVKEFCWQEKNKEVFQVCRALLFGYIVSTLHGHKPSNICDFTPRLKSVVISSMMMLKTNYSLVKRFVSFKVFCQLFFLPHPQEEGFDVNGEGISNRIFEPPFSRRKAWLNLCFFQEGILGRLLTAMKKHKQPRNLQIDIEGIKTSDENPQCAKGDSLDFKSKKTIWHSP